MIQSVQVRLQVHEFVKPWEKRVRNSISAGKEGSTGQAGQPVKTQATMFEFCFKLLQASKHIELTFRLNRSIRADLFPCNFDKGPRGAYGWARSQNVDVSFLHEKCLSDKSFL